MGTERSGNGLWSHLSRRETSVWTCWVSEGQLTKSFKISSSSDISDLSESVSTKILDDDDEVVVVLNKRSDPDV